MYQVGIEREFVAQHFFVDGKNGEQHPHSHAFKAEVICSGKQLDERGFLVDILDLEQALQATSNYFQDQLLNDLPEFSGIAPSVENFARVFGEKFYESLSQRIEHQLLVKMWENSTTWASYTKNLRTK